MFDGLCLREQLTVPGMGAPIFLADGRLKSRNAIPPIGSLEPRYIGRLPKNLASAADRSAGWQNFLSGSEIATVASVGRRFGFGDRLVNEA